MNDRNPALARLDVLVGRWTVQPRVEGVGPAWTGFAWRHGGRYLEQVVDVDSIPAGTPRAWRENAPFPTYAVIGFDDATDEFTMLYADGRGVHRVYRMTFAGREWRIWREAPGFNQRFVGTVTADEASIDARWERSEDGVTWDLDFGLSYVRQA
ncbi:hypothetical protein AB0J86_21600 [Micromonospora sp. NPDC049559]|uniref:hypothetical protein n=1 Tax=Micromonospora sp. NPDC049559 TaxID=3155923 RepID=UPI00343D5AE8